ncbi:hypothetical protein ACR1PO_15610 [Chryseobacterium sp. RRHN12]|uniref:hypothetical protein n=1 Tax=Chryseobacterium sp. RRHN12 TaxID=3437884 RepID=UPI003D9B3136
MKELEELTRDIREKLPRLKNSIKAERLQDSKNNCWRIFMGGIFMGTTSNNELSKYVVKHINDDEIKLNNVMEWINIIHEGDRYYFFIFKELYYRLFEFWNLSNPYLKDQSPELITFLHSLIKTKQ